MFEDVCSSAGRPVLSLFARNLIANCDNTCGQSIVAEILQQVIGSANVECQQVLSVLQLKDQVSFNLHANNPNMFLTSYHALRSALINEHKYSSNLGTAVLNSVKYGKEIWAKFEENLVQQAIDRIREVKVTEETEFAKNQKINETMLKNLEEENIELEKRIRLAQERLTLKQKELSDMKEHISTQLEIKKNEVVKLVELTAQPASRNSIPPLSEISKYNEIEEEKSKLKDMIKTVGVINKLTYCQVVSYKCSEIVIETLLSQVTIIKLQFQMTNNACSSELAVENIHVDISYVGGVPSGERDLCMSERERLLAGLFFSRVMCCDATDGALSSRSLSQVAVPSDIPACLLKVRILFGYIFNYY